MRGRALSALCLAACLAGGCFSPQASTAPASGAQAAHPGPDIRVLMDLGMAYAESGRWEQATDRFQRALALDPQFAPAHYGMGRVHFMRQQYEEAERELQEAIRLDPSYPDAYVLLSLVSQAIGDLRGAIGRVEQAVELYQARRARATQAGNPAAWSEEDRAILERLERRVEKLRQQQGGAKAP